MNRSTPSLHTMDQERENLINTYLLPILGTITANQAEYISGALYQHVQLRHAVKGEYLEEPGPAMEGRCLLLPQSLAHSFQPVSTPDHFQMVGTMIWPRRSLIFHPDALQDGHLLTEITQVLEPGPYLIIRYPVLLELLREHSALRHIFHILSRHQSRQRRYHDQLLHLPPNLRVNRFEKQFPAFCHVASINQRAMHVSLSRQSYVKNLTSKM